ncbi:hypothetical protein Pd630_LPD09041 (plasmid) [Rhodococcus opacus PD630]|nr:hypothetical protein Pd630_LPD09041 [Rhodococcus opacus PD630]
MTAKDRQRGEVPCRIAYTGRCQHAWALESVDSPHGDSARR